MGPTGPKKKSRQKSALIDPPRVRSLFGNMKKILNFVYFVLVPVKLVEMGYPATYCGSISTTDVDDRSASKFSAATCDIFDSKWCNTTCRLKFYYILLMYKGLFITILRPLPKNFPKYRLLQESAALFI